LRLNWKKNSNIPMTKILNERILLLKSPGIFPYIRSMIVQLKRKGISINFGNRVWHPHTQATLLLGILQVVRKNYSRPCYKPLFLKGSRTKCGRRGIIWGGVEVMRAKGWVGGGREGVVVSVVDGGVRE